ncbi:MAG: hypothetical protein HKP57_12230 [Halobacteria archaeon]|nr:hypothetical protein [Halobacteria archaeon]
MSDSYCIWIVTPPGYAHAAAFHEVAIGLQGGFRELGMQVPIVQDRARIRSRAIVLGANLLPDMPGVKPPGKSILFNLEQITPGSGWLTTGYLKLLKRHPVWDYSRYNIEQLGKLGISNITHCPIGYSDVLQRIAPAPEKDIDVLFYGSINPRRLAILEALARADLRVETLFGVYGEQRDAVIARSRLVLNIHYYPAKIFEIVRISWLLANAVCVVSEDSPLDSALESVQDGIVQAPYDRLVDTCRKVIRNNRWETTGRKGYEIFSGNRQSAYLRGIIGRKAA